MPTTITRTFDSTPTDQTYFSLTDNMSSSNLGNLQVPDGATRISRVDFTFACFNPKGYEVVCSLSGSNMSEQNFTLMGVDGDGTADSGIVNTSGSCDVAFPVMGVNNIDLQIAIQYASGGSATASSGAVTLYFE